MTKVGAVAQKKKYKLLLQVTAIYSQWYEDVELAEGEKPYIDVDLVSRRLAYEIPFSTKVKVVDKIEEPQS